MNAVDGLVDLILKTSGKNEKTYSYDTEGVVQRVEDGIAYVRIGESFETPAKMSVAAAPGERVRVRVSNNRAYLVGNTSEPPTGDRAARVAYTQATEAKTNAAEALTVAQGAQESADIAADAASRAQVSADNAETDARRANVAAESAIEDAGRAYTAAESATTSANNAIVQLSTVESVVNTLGWLTEHSNPTKDTSVVEGKNYFVKNPDGTFRRIADPTGNPKAKGWYEMDDAVSNYIAAHLALTDYGLNLVLDNSRYRIHIGTYTAKGKDGVYIIDGAGNVVTYFGDSITFADNLPFYVGTENSYILFNPITNKIEINGDVVFGSKSLTQLLTEINNSTEANSSLSGAINTIQNRIENGDASALVLNVETDYSDAQTVTLKAQLRKGNREVTSSYSSTMFYWYEKSETGVNPLGTGYSITYNRSNAGYGTAVVCQFTVDEDILLITPDDNLLLTPDGKALFAVVN